MRVEKEISALMDEAKSIKASFTRTATNIILHTKKLTFTTSKNEISIVIPGGYTSNYFDIERVVLTLNTTNGKKSIAKLELTTNKEVMYPDIKQIPYNGGARWIITGWPRTSGPSDWVATTYNFTVHTMMDGELSARMIWQQ